MKQYNGEKAIISLTSWKARINTVDKTIYSLLSSCPGFHIVLVLSEEEFPQKEAELPDNLMLFINNDLIEILWVHKNYKSFKKFIFTMDKYPDIPVISADDDCLYTSNYAEKLYNVWKNNKQSCVVYSKERKIRNKYYWVSGCRTLYPPKCFDGAINLINDEIIKTNEDDAFYSIYLKKYKKPIIYNPCNNINEILIFHDEIQPLKILYDKKLIEHIKIIEKNLNNKNKIVKNL